MDAASTFYLALKIGVAAMITLWAVSVPKRDASLVDLWWGPGFSVAAVVVWAFSGAPLTTPALVALALVIAWSARLGALMARRRRRHPGEDPRYTALRKAWDPGFWWKSLGVVFLLQAVIQWVVAFPAMAAASTATGALGVIGVLGAAVALGGLAVETVADNQLDAHRARHGSGSVCTTGLRAHVRYPNYLGEIAFWWGFWLIALDSGAWWSLVSPVLITFLLVKVSGAPMLEERLGDGRPGFAEWKARTPAFLPRFGRSAAAAGGQPGE
ncbi:MAG: DUF1295 domain-containing protein [Rhodobacteraceae bacterium]|nr:MAG: DUF1295 domain-containing protein [Paracoccaceae bacterium]